MDALPLDRGVVEAYRKIKIAKAMRAKLERAGVAKRHRGTQGRSDGRVVSSPADNPRRGRRPKFGAKVPVTTEFDDENDLPAVP
jgi:hypothetical protein